MEHNTWHKVDPKFIWSYPLKGFLFGILTTAVLAYPAYFITLALNDWQANVGPFFLFGILFSFLLVVPGTILGLATYNEYIYCLEETSLRTSAGLLTKLYIAIPYRRIQNVEIHRGIIDRILGLSTLKIQTAGASADNFTTLGLSNAEATIVALKPKTATELAKHLTKLAKGARNEKTA